MLHPVSTYRIQFHKGFTFQDLERILPYLQKLGIKTVYASPIFKATPGSTHGYDGLDPNQINPEVGTQDQLHALSKKLALQGINWLQDIVPNHMAFDMRNPWLVDVLEKGTRSLYASFFDIDWNSPVYDGRVMVPFLGSPLEDVIRKGELKLAYTGERLVLQYYDAAYPLNIESYRTVLAGTKDDAPKAATELAQHYQAMQRIAEPAAYSELFEKSMAQFAALFQQEPLRAWIEKNIAQINNDPELLTALAQAQEYQLCHWQETDRHINYRRFFTVNGLICLNIQDHQVFDTFHQLIDSLVKEGVFQGLRVDHIDGLYDPAQYLDRLRQLAGEETYIIVEKILKPEERLPGNWPVQGNTGYDFLAMVNNLFTNNGAKKVFTQFFYTIAKDHRTIAQQIRDAKRYILTEHMGGELDNLYQLFKTSHLADPLQLESLSEEVMKHAIGSFLVHCPVYRFYGNHLPLSDGEAKEVQDILATIRQSEPATEPAVSLLENIFLKTPYQEDEQYNRRATHFYQRCMQFSGPLMAKGVEDTVMYTFNRFIGHNEVGDSPEAFGYTVDAFHQHMKLRQQDASLSLNATATHDTKRGEDYRARLSVLTELPGEWLEAVSQWQALNNDLKEAGAPDAIDEYFIYQTVIGSYPMQGEERDYSDRLQEYLQKALREAKRHSNWTTPNELYEQSVKKFAVALLDTKRPFWQRFQKLHAKLVPYGIVNSLVQVILKFTCPGVPDVYQGCEGWDLSFVDPDNRRPVPYESLQQTLDALPEETDGKLLQQLWKDKTDARIKMWLVRQLIQLRNTYADLFAYGDYVSLQVVGSGSEHILAFARRHKQTWCVVIVPLHLAKLAEEQHKRKSEPDWNDTMVILPREVGDDWEDVWRGIKGKKGKGIQIKDVFKSVPFAVLKMQGVDNARKAGILLHITSLPSRYGIGDLGTEALRFADFLYRTRQHYWQLLPINPTEGGQGHSPYSSTSSRAGNTLLISPELLVKDGVLTREIINQYALPNEGKVDFETAERVKGELFERAWDAFNAGNGAALQPDFERFKEAEREWLPDFALYSVLKKKYKGKPWYEWPDAFKFREAEAIETVTAEHSAELEYVKWLQFIFAKQWQSLKTYCNTKNIQLLGDLPIYVSYDSADVWAHKEIFKLDDEGNRLGLAGVPPDAFSEDGQLWGMPVYNWDVLKERDYDWWVERLRKNSQLFDVIRLDHFRAFADYWEVPAGEETARNGTWVPGPGSDFFTAIQKQLGELPFVAEDLGEINDAVLQLRDEFKLPGMKILQFAFGEDVAGSDYIPHNYTPNFIAYTGTHDNNTTRGWYRKEADGAMRTRINQYLAREINETNVAYFFCRLAHASVAKTVILPMQDVLGLDETARMNTPASGNNNWGWRMRAGQLNQTVMQQLREWTKTYNRE